MILLTKRTAALVWEPGTAKGFGCLDCADEIPFGLLNINTLAALANMNMCSALRKIQLKLEECQMRYMSCTTCCNAAHSDAHATSFMVPLLTIRTRNRMHVLRMFCAEKLFNL